MNFVNRYILGFGVVALLASLAFFTTQQYFFTGQQYIMGWVTAIIYGCILFFSALIIGKLDIYSGYAGLNYHLTTYVVCNSVLLVLVSTGMVTNYTLSNVYSMMLSWGICTIPHFIVFLLMRKRSIKGMDKKELFD